MSEIAYEFCGKVNFDHFEKKIFGKERYISGRDTEVLLTIKVLSQIKNILIYVI